MKGLLTQLRNYWSYPLINAGILFGRGIVREEEASAACPYTKGLWKPMAWCELCGGFRPEITRVWVDDLFGSLPFFQNDISILKFKDFKVIFEAAFETVEEVIVERPFCGW